MIKRLFFTVVIFMFIATVLLASESSGTVVLPSWVAWILGIALVPIIGHVFWVSFKLSKIDDLNDTIKGLSGVMTTVGEAIKSLDQYIRLRDQILDKRD